MADVRIKFIAETQNFSLEIDKANASLRQFGMEGATLGQALKSKNLDAVSAVMARNRNATLASGDALKAFKNETNDLGKVFKAVAKDSEGWEGTFANEDGSSGPLGNLTSGEALGRLKDMADVTNDMTKAVKEYYASIPADGRSTDPFSSDTFIEEVRSKGDAISQFGTELEAVNKKMAMISTEGQRLVLSGGDPEEIKKLSDEYHRLSNEHDRLSQSANGTSTRIKNLVKNFVSAQLVVFAIRKTFQLVTQGFKESSLAAAQAEQVTQKFLTVFEGFSKASESVNVLVNSYGLTTSSAKDMLANIGDMAYGLGASTQEAALFAAETAEFIQDLIAFKDIGGDVIEITQAFMSGAAGNTRNFRQWGSIVKEATVQNRIHAKGLDVLTGSSLEWAKAQERVAIVMEQQKNALGATEKEWDMMLSVNRRYTEQMKQSKEIAGKYINDFLHPVKKAILDMAEAWNIVQTAKRNYMDNPENPNNEVLWGETMRSAMSTHLVKTYPSSWGVKQSMSEDAFKRMVTEFGAPWEEAITLVKTYVGLTSTAEASLRSYYQNLEQVQALEKEHAEELERSTQGAKELQTELTWLGDTFLNLGAISFSSREAGEFSKQFSLENMLGLNTDEADLNAKMQGLFSIAEELNNKIVIETAKGIAANTSLLTAWNDALISVTAGIKDANTELQLLSFTKQQDSLFSQIKALEKRNELEAIYGKENTDIIGVLMDQHSAEMEALKLKNEAIEAGMDASAAETARLSLVETIGILYNQQLDIAMETADAKRQQEESERKINAILEAREKISELSIENQAGSRNLQRPGNSSIHEDARFGLSEKKIANNVAVRDLEKSFLTEQQLAAISSSSGALTAAMMLSADQIAEVSTYRRELETNSELEYQQALKDARDESLSDIRSLWENLGDINLVKGWIDTYQNVKKYETDVNGTSEADASDIAVFATLESIIFEFLGHLETVNELLGIVTSIFEALAPILDSFLAPLVLFLRPIGQILADLIYPVLLILFPVIKGIGMTLVLLMAAIETVTNAFSWMFRTIEVFIWNLSHLFNKKEFPNLGEETKKIWDDAWSDIEDIANLELQSRADFVTQLTDAQQGELAAYEEMYQNGLLTFSEFDNMVKSNIYGKNVDTPRGSSNSLGTNVTMGNVSITVNAGTVSDPAELARLVSAELAKATRRGGSYAVA